MEQLTIAMPSRGIKTGFNNQGAASVDCNKPIDRTEKIAIASTARLRSCSYSELRKLNCKTEYGTLIISGHVSSFYWKQLAQEVIRPISQSMFIDNRVDVLSSFPQKIRNGPLE